jgi:hypothetical protein
MQNLPVILIDGNNLAHFLYTNLSPGQKMTAADSRRLISHLSSYARQYAEDIEIECCLDRPTKSDQTLPHNMRVLSAKFPKTGDELLLERFNFHLYNNRSCLVVTNDEAILDEVKVGSGSTMLVSTFVRRPGIHNPVFRDPLELPPLPFLNSANEPSRFSEIKSHIKLQPDRKKRKMGTRDNIKEIIRLESPQIERVLPSKPKQMIARPAPPVEVGPFDPGQQDPRYILDFTAWPCAEGIKFLLGSFCPDHRTEYHEMMHSFGPDVFHASDLPIVAELLRNTCSSEADFVTRGGSLMGRVRLALIQAGGEIRSLSEMAERTGLKEKGLRGRIKEKAGNWVQIQ